jgi:membrane peptidoglycan carboxypeptidase
VLAAILTTLFILRFIFRHIATRLYHKKYYQLRNRLLAEYELVKLSDPNNSNLLCRLLISGEDHRFYYHIGFDLIAIARAVRNRIFYRKVEGASTIEQQLVRVLTNEFHKTARRKIQEMLLATTVSSIVPKNSIPKIYLNVAYFGTGMNGLTQTCSKLGVIDQETLPIEQAAEIVSRIKYPQPSKFNQNRLRQIEMRKHHLIKLYNSHLNRRYFKIYG